MPPEWSLPGKVQTQFLIAECYMSYPSYLKNLTIYSEHHGTFSHTDSDRA